MISDQEIARVAEKSAKFRPAILNIKYEAVTDRLEFELAWCTLAVHRKEIYEFRDLSPEDMSKIYVSAVGIHIDSADLDINSAACIIEIMDRIKNELIKSY